MKIGVLALQGDVREHVQALLDCHADPVEVRRPEDLTAVEALVLPGGESTTLSLLMSSAELRSPLAERLAGGMPAFGTCAGMILLAEEVLDGRPDQQGFGLVDITVRRNGFGRQVESFERDVSVSGIAGGPMTAVFIRAPLVTRTGPGVDTLASIPWPLGSESSYPVVCRQGPILVAAFHPELSGDHRLHQLFLSIVEEERR